MSTTTTPGPTASDNLDTMIDLLELEEEATAELRVGHQFRAKIRSDIHAMLDVEYAEILRALNEGTAVLSRAMSDTYPKKEF